MIHMSRTEKKNNKQACCLSASKAYDKLRINCLSDTVNKLVPSLQYPHVLCPYIVADRTEDCSKHRHKVIFPDCHQVVPDRQ